MFDIYNTHWSEYFWKYCPYSLKTSQNYNDFIKISKWYAIRGYEDPDYYGLEFIETIE